MRKMCTARQRNNRLDIVQKLLDEKANMELEGNTPIHFVVEQAAIAELMVQHGVSLKLRIKLGLICCIELENRRLITRIRI